MSESNLRRALSRARLAALLGAGALVAAACHSSADEALQAELSDACSINTDCASPLICAFQTCHQECSSSRDCMGTGLSGRCVESDRPFHVCLATREASCVHNSDCPGAEVCAVDLQCRDQCASSRDCIEGQVCTSGVCADPSSLVNGLLPQDSVDGGTCVYSTDCPAALVCLSSVCTVECITAKDCLATYACQDTRCVPPGFTGPVPGQGDDGGADGGPDGGTSLGKACALDGECQDSTFCNGVEACVEGHCAAGSSPCDDHSACTTDTCTEASATCTHTTIGGPSVDADGDGHPAIGCGNGDDCDDSDRKNFPGNAEVCDFRDNNCNGLVDEGLWQQKSSTSSTSLPPPTPPSQYSGGLQGTPGVLALPNGTYALLEGAAFSSNDGSFEGEDAFYAYLVGSNDMATAGPVNVAPGGSGSYDPDAQCGCEHGQLEAFSVATDGAGHFAFGAEDDGTCLDVCSSPNISPRAVGGVAGTNLQMPQPLTLGSSSDGEFTTGPAAPVWLPSLAKFAFIWRGEPAGGGPSVLQTTTITGTSSPATVDGAHSLFANDTTTTALTLAQSTSSAATMVKVVTNGSTIFVAWASPAGAVRYSVFNSTLTLPSTPVDLAQPEDTLLVDVIADGSSYVLLTQDGMRKNARIRYVDATSGAPGVSAQIPGAMPGTTLHLTAQGSGFALIENGPSAYRIGWAPGSLAVPENTSVTAPAGSQEGPFSFSTLTLTSGGNGEARLVSLDPLHYVLFGSGGTVTQVSCGP